MNRDLEQRLTPRTVLLVDAHADSRRAYRMILQHAGYHTLEASNGEEALQVAHRERPGLIIMELTLPLLDGAQVARSLKADPRTRQIPILMLTTSSDSAEKEEAERSGCEGFLLKPCRPQQLLEEVERSAAHREMQVWTQVLTLPAEELVVLAEAGGLDPERFAPGAA